LSIIRLEVKGFRSLRDAVWEPGALNILIGPNAGGKSNLLKLLEMLQQSAEGRLKDYVMASGGMGAVVCDGAHDGRIGVRVLAYRPFEDGEHWVDRAYDHALELRRVGRSAEYQVAVETLSADYKRDDNREAARQLFARKLDVPDGAHTETLLSLARHPLDPFGDANDMRAFEGSWAVYQGFRSDPDCAIRGASIAAHHDRLEGDGANLATYLHTLTAESRTLKDDVDSAMSAAFGEEYEELLIRPVASQRVELAIRWRSRRNVAPAAELSDGTLRFLFLIAALANPEPPPLIAIDEPELGLHPSMFSIVAEFAAEASSRTQVGLTTHSPEFLDAFTDLGDRLTVTVVEAPAGATVLRNVSGESLDHWLKEYRLGEMFRSGTLEGLA